MNSHFNKNLVRLHFSKAASSYDLVTPVQARMGDELLDFVQKGHSFRNNYTILEIGCGTGNLTEKLLKSFPQSRITAMDISPAMIDRAKQKIGISSQVDFVTQDAETYIDTYKFQRKFDLIISNATVQWFRDPKISLPKYKNLLAANGIFGFSTFGSKTFCELRQSFLKAQKVLGLPPTPHTLDFYSQEEWRMFLKESDSSRTKVKENYHKEIYPGVREFLQVIKQAGASFPSSQKRMRLNRKLLHRMNQEYKEDFSLPSLNSIVATYHIIYVRHIKNE